MKFYTKKGTDFKFVLSASAWHCDKLNVGLFYSRDEKTFIQLPTKETVGVSDLCKICKNQFSCIANNIQSFTDIDICT